MLTPPTISPADVAPVQGAGPNRPPPQAGAAPEARRFAELLQRRRDAQPPAHAPQAQAQPQTAPNAPSPAQPVARATQDDAAHAKAADDGAPSDDGTLGERALHEAPPGAAAPKSKTLAKGPPLPPEAPRDGSLQGPAVDATAPQLASDAAASSADPGVRDSRNADADAAPAGDPTRAPAGADPAFWPGVAMAPIAAAPAGAPPAAAPFGAGAAGAVAGAAGALPGAAAGNATGASLAGSTAGDAGTGRDGAGAGAGGREEAAPDAAALRAAAAPGAAAGSAAGAAANAAPGTAGERFALPPRTPEVTQPGWAGGVVPHRIDATGTAQVALPTPLNAPDFAKALGAQVSVFARNGLAHAELQLTPAEMGPIRVQIAIDGAHARVDFAADSAATRQVIERGLPELASALREQGLTLAGGGVFQRAPDQHGDGEANPPIGRARRSAAAPAEAVEPTRVARVAARPGGVDLYA